MFTCFICDLEKIDTQRSDDFFHITSSDICEQCADFILTPGAEIINLAVQTIGNWESV